MWSLACDVYGYVNKFKFELMHFKEIKVTKAWQKQINGLKEQLTTNNCLVHFKENLRYSDSEVNKLQL